MGEFLAAAGGKRLRPVAETVLPRSKGAARAPFPVLSASPDRRSSAYLIMMYIVISNPYRISVYAGFVHCMLLPPPPRILIGAFTRLFERINELSQTGNTTRAQPS